MKVSVPKDFGNISKKPILQLVPEPIKSVKKEDLTTVNVYSDPGDHASTQVKMTFKGLDGDNEMPQEILGWRRNVERALTGLDLTAGATQYNMAKQLMWGSALSTFKSTALVLLTNHKDDAIVHAKEQLAAHPAHGAVGHDAVLFQTLRDAATTATNRKALDHLMEAYGVGVVTDLLNDVVKCLLPNKTLQRVKRPLRREARKPIDMSVKQCIMRIYRINTKEIPCCLPAFNHTQCLSDNEIVEILLFGTPKSWQREMDHQGIDPMTRNAYTVSARP